MDYEHVGENEIETRILGPEFRDLSPDFRHGEFYAEVRVGGEVRVEFKITLEWNAGYVTVDYTALLFEGTSESTTDLDGIHSDIYVLNDNTSEHRTFMVKNAAEDSPDSARIEFRLENIQKP